MEAAMFAAWLPTSHGMLERVVAGTSRYCRLIDMRCSVVGNIVYVLFEFATGDAAGQNMVTAAGRALCSSILASSPVAPQSWLAESVLSGDKRSSPMAFRSARGRNASAEIVLPAKQVRRYWHADVADMVRAWQQATGGAVQTGAVGLQGNVANALAALFIACGQDAACIAEACTALTRVEATRDGDAYFSVTLPNLIVGTVGGGTFLPTAQECLAMLGCVGTGGAGKFAEIVAAVALAGEIAIVGAMASGAFAAAHVAASDRARMRSVE
jgi:hydroxymethylglutaryl-CoA reductase (NADPH)